MDERLSTVLDMLEQSDSRTSEQLASELGVTSRTVRTLISQSQRQLRAIGAEIESKPGVGYRLVVSNRCRRRSKREPVATVEKGATRSRWRDDQRGCVGRDSVSACQ
ncbi:HTH domain-containing protein [Luteococcus sp. H138]|uniref:HTH domain-containing protein n=1 Tax=unclassified Luteococcus TaxID=2639923 RepID=UPI00406C6F44